MKYRILYQPSYSLLDLILETSESIIAEADAMVTMSPNITMDTGSKGGVFGAFKRAMGGESMFQNTFIAKDGEGTLTLAPTMMGDIIAREMKGESLIVQSGSFLASAPSINLDTKWGGGKMFFSGEGLFALKASGTGMLFLSSYGAIHSITLGDGEKLVMDTGHMVAFDANMDYKVRTVGGLKQTFFSGEGLVVDLTGPGTIYIQTRNFNAFVSYLIPKLPFKKD